MSQESGLRKQYQKEKNIQILTSQSPKCPLSANISVTITDVLAMDIKAKNALRML